MNTLKVATFNVNGIGTRLPHLLQWLAKEQPDVACLQELKAVDTKFPQLDLQNGGLRRDLARPAVLERRGDPRERCEARGNASRAARRSRGQAEPLPRSRRDGIVVACLYLPNGNPQPGPKFDYKLAWFERFIERARHLTVAAIPW